MVQCNLCMKRNIQEIAIAEYDYPLPDERIAKYPLAERDTSKLLLYRGGEIDEDTFAALPKYIPQGSLMVFNNTKVIQARLRFRKETGATIEVFCLEPERPCDYQQIFLETEECVWQCLVGNSNRWKSGVLSQAIEVAGKMVTLSVERIGDAAAVNHIRFFWDGGCSFAELLEAAGELPIPPYLNRRTEESDTRTYQTVYSKVKGSVAAPTAGLHFTENVLESIRNKGVVTDTVCLHVGAGTFLPVKSSLVAEHTMHREPFVVTLELLERLIERKGKVVAVGTTSVRTLESLYYAGVSCIENGRPEDVGQWDPYSREYDYPTDEALKAIVDYLKTNGLKELKIGTRIIIVPGFRFRLVDILVTNFHQPQSTLLLLISAFVDGDWRRIYDYALANDFRFLSYGDSSILFRR